MADNVTFQTTVATPADGTIVAAREVSAGGDTAQVQLITLAAVTGSEGAYTLREFLKADDAAFTPGTDAVAMMGYTFDDSSTDTLDEGDAGAARIDGSRRQLMRIVGATDANRADVDASGHLQVDIAASSATVTVSGTVDLGATDNAVLDNIDADLTTIIGHVDGIETLLGTIDADTGSILTAVELIDDVVYVDDADWTNDTSKHLLVGGLYQSSPQTVTDGDVAPFNITANGALHVAVQGTVTVGSHAVTNAGTFAVQVDGAALTALQLIDNIVKLEDDPHSSADAGVMLLAVRQDAQADFGADGDYVPLSIDADGQLRVNAGTVTASADSEFADDAAFTLTSSVVTMAGAIKDNTLSNLAAAEGDAVPLRVDINGAVWGRLTDVNAAVLLFGNAGDAQSNTRTLLPVDARTSMFNGTDWDRIRGDTTNGLLVNLGSNNDVTVTGDALTALQLIDDVIYVDDADWTDSTSKHALVGGLYQSAPQTVTDGDVAPFNITVNGALHTSLVTALPAGTNGIGKLTSNSGVDIGDVDVTSISAGTNLIGDVGIQPRTTNGLTTAMASGSDGSSILVATAQVIKASAGKLYGYYLYNPEAAVTFVHFYNTAAASVTVGTTNPLFTLPIPAGSAANLVSDIGITFSNAGWSWAATTTAGGNTAPATGVSAIAWYA